MNAVNRSDIFETLPVRQAVCKQIVPAVVSQMIALIYNLADTYFVGMLNDPHQTAAITIAAPSFVMLTAISNLFGVGGASAIARSLGKKQILRAKQIASVSFWGGLFCACLFSLIFFTLSRPILFLSGATEETYEITLGYAKYVVILGGPFTVLNTLLANLIRAEGRAGLASFGVSLGGIINIVLDPLFVLPKFIGFGAIGAGMATALSNAAATIFFLAALYHLRKTSVIHIEPQYLRFAKLHLKNILSVGFPSAVQYALTVVAIAAQAKFVSQYATEAVAALGIVKKLDQLPLYFSIGVSSGLLPLLAYNYAAGNQRRRQQAFRFGCMISLSFSLLCLICYECFAPQLAALFIEDETTIIYSAGFLRRMVTAMPMMSLCYPLIIQFQAMGKVKESLITSVMRKGVLDIPLLFVMDRLMPLYGCMWVQPIVDSVSLIVAGSMYYRLKQKENTISALD